MSSPFVSETKPASDDAKIPTPRGGRMSAEDRRRQIVRIAMALFSQKGFNGTTTKEIAAQAGISEAMIFRHFATKRDLYTAILDEKGHACDEHVFWEQMRELAAAKDDKGLFRTWARKILDTHRQDGSFTRLMLFSALEGHELSDIFVETRVRDAYRFLCPYIAERIADGVMRPIEPLVIVRGFVGMVFHFVFTEQLFEKSGPFLETEQLVEEVTRLFLDGAYVKTENKEQ